MNYYTLKVNTGTERQYLKRVNPLLEPRPEKLIWIRRKLVLRKNGIHSEQLAPVFPGYLFLEAKTLTAELFSMLRHIPGFHRFLYTNNDIRPLSDKDREIITRFLTFGEVLELSDVTFEVDNRITVVSGPLEGMEGNIIKVDRRKGRAKVKLELYKDSFTVDFGFRDIQRAHTA